MRNNTMTTLDDKTLDERLITLSIYEEDAESMRNEFDTEHFKNTNHQRILDTVEFKRKLIQALRKEREKNDPTKVSKYMAEAERLERDKNVLIEALEQTRCGCTLAEIESGHLLGCWGNRS